jgi:hypothetical protein
LNLLANFVDNLTHGAAIGGSFAVSPLVGMATLAGIIIHEIPHEMEDLSILLKSGFNRWQAIKAQMLTGLRVFLVLQFLFSIRIQFTVCCKFYCFVKLIIFLNLRYSLGFIIYKWCTYLCSFS